MYENQAVVDWAIQQVQLRMERPASNLIHASELTQGLRKSYYQRTQPRQLSAENITLFADGFALQEWFLGKEHLGSERDGIIFSVDYLADDILLEFKSTRMSYETKARGRFNPATNDYWMRRTMLYCYGHNKLKAHILVFFRFQSALHAWTVEFGQAELDENWQLHQVRKQVLLAALDRGSPPSVTSCQQWEHELCSFLDLCIAEIREIEPENAVS